MARNPDFGVNFSVIDRSAEMSRFTVNTEAAVDVGTPPTELTDFVTAFGTICDGTILSYNSIGTNRLATGAYANAGNREEKWLLVYHDTTTLAKYKIELPCRKSSLQPPVETDKVVLASSPYANFKTKFEAFAFSPDGNAVVLDDIILVGRNV